MAHQKHAKLARPAGGQWGRTEVAILGAPCGEIKALVGEISRGLAGELPLAYVDADHHAPASGQWTALDYGVAEQLTDKITHYELQYAGERSHFFSAADLVLVNGNHFTAHTQIAWVHPKKSLAKKLPKLTNVGLVILDEGLEALPGFLAEHVAGKGVKVVPRREVAAIVAYIKTLVTANRPPLYGLVLTGGRSTRMQQDKSQLVYHGGVPHYQYLAGLLGENCAEVFVSVRDEEQAGTFSLPAITDKFIGLGPYGGILSAFQHNPNAAWLVVAVDLPFLDAGTLNYLTAQRDTTRVATCFIDPQGEFPEPLITIWEPRAYPVLLGFLGRGYSCPRKVLINSEVKVLEERDPAALTNVNTPEELAAIRQHLEG